MTLVGGLFKRRDPPVDYGPVRPWLQRVRALLVGVLLLVCLVGLVAGLENIWLPATACAVVMVDALIRSRLESGVTGSLVVDAMAVGLAIGFVEGTEPALIAATAYLVTAAMAFGGLRTLAMATGSLAVALGANVLLPFPDAAITTTLARLIIWVAVIVFLTAMLFTLLSASSAVQAARARQDGAMEDVQRASEIKSEFVSMISHELRTPLTNISGFADTLKHGWRGLPEEEIDEFLGIIASESDHLGNLVDDVLAIPRLEAGRLLLESTQFPLRPAAYKVADLIFPASGDRSASVTIGGNVSVMADPNRVDQVLRNLLENARKYGGDQVTVTAHRRGDEWVITVGDNGPGVAPEHRERIFDAFEQSSAGNKRTESGFGLGLSVARHLVEAMNGRIWYEQGFPVGARFCFTLPAAAERAAGKEKVA
jgi:signal transduction histidine kinase